MNTLNVITELPDVYELKLQSQSLAVLDAILMPDWEYRYFSFNNKWNHSESMASMRDGSGDEYFLLFNESGVVGKVFTKKLGALPKKELESLLKTLSKEFINFVTEKAFVLEDTSFIFWNESKLNKWLSKPTDKNLPLLNFLSKEGHLNTYLSYAEEYYEKQIDINIVNKIFSHVPLNEKIIKSLNNDLNIEAVLEDIEEIGYPLE